MKSFSFSFVSEIFCLQIGHSFPSPIDDDDDDDEDEDEDEDEDDER